MLCYLDVYDCAQWKGTFGPAPALLDPKTRVIKLLFCYDGFPAHNYNGAKSLVPGEVVVLSLPPWLRYKVDNILISMLFPDGLSAHAQKKFFDKIIKEDFLPLFTEGVTDPIAGNIVKVEIFGTVCEFKNLSHPLKKYILATRYFCHTQRLLTERYDPSVILIANTVICPECDPDC